MGPVGPDILWASGRIFGGEKTSFRPSTSWKNKHLGADIHDINVRTSLGPKDCSQRYRSEKLRAECLFHVHVAGVSNRGCGDRSLSLSRLFQIYLLQFFLIFSIFSDFQGKKKHININKFAGLSRVWVGGKNLFMFFFRVIPHGGEKTHKQNPPINPGTIP